MKKNHETFSQFSHFEKRAHFENECTFRKKLHFENECIFRKRTHFENKRTSRKRTIFFMHSPVRNNLQLINSCFTIISSHFFARYIDIFYKNEVQSIIFRCLTCLYLNWFKSYDTKRQKPETPKMQNCQNWWFHAKIFSSLFIHFYEYPNEKLR